MVTKLFETQTVPSKQTVVDDKLKPTAELQLLVGGPYTLDGEEHRYGHTALRIKGPAIDLTYDFGRYGDVRGLFGESGDGILRVWSDFAPYIKGENALGRVTTGFVYPLFDHQVAAVKAYFDGLIALGKPMPGRDRAGMKVYRLATDYHALAPNCTTLSLDGAKQAFPNIDAGSEKFNKPGDVLSGAERLALAAKGGAPRLFLPANLQSFLGSGSPVKAIRVDQYPASQR
jgi:hypothetical protein